jgi:two-component system sensor histidine kinase CpxA
MPAQFFEDGPPTRATLIAMSNQADANELFVTQSPWLKLLFGSIAITAGIWLPFISSLTSSLGKMTTVAELIARGKLDARVESERRDELGELSQSIDDMATRLEGHVNGQKQFLGDIAHELSSPIVRMRFALGILDQKLGEAHRTGLLDLEEEVENMSSLVEELLAFSKASLRPEQVTLKPVNVTELISSVIRRESNDGEQFNINAPADLAAFAEEQLLSRALGNVIRNAIRYAGFSGPIKVSATREGGTVHICVLDSGPGIPVEHLPKVFSPFYRPDSSRTRNTGGAGLGLSIVKTCVETCQGTVFCQNHKPSGLAVTIILRAADSIASDSF